MAVCVCYEATVVCVCEVLTCGCVCYEATVVCVCEVLTCG